MCLQLMLPCPLFKLRTAADSCIRHNHQYRQLTLAPPVHFTKNLGRSPLSNCPFDSPIRPGAVCGYLDLRTPQALDSVTSGDSKRKEKRRGNPLCPLLGPPRGRDRCKPGHGPRRRISRYSPELGRKRLGLRVGRLTLTDGRCLRNR